jgi:hypothetical protein
MIVNEKYSYSKISTYLQCPFSYKKQYIDKVSRSLSWQLALGITTADILERIYKDEVILKEGISDYLLKELVKEYWIPNQYKKEYSSDIPTSIFLGYKSIEDEQKQKENLVKWLESYFKIYSLKKVFGVEVPFEVQFDDFILIGRLDRLDLINNKLYIIDNKVTSKFLNDLFTSIQLGIYFYAISRMIPRFGISKVGYYYIKQGKETLIDSSRLEIDLIYSNIRRAVQGIRDNSFTPCKNQYCYFCDFKEECNK